MNQVLLSFDTTQNPQNPEENQLLNPSSPNIHKKFSTQISIHSLKNYVERICLKIKAFSFMVIILLILITYS